MFFSSQVMRLHQVRKICIRGLLITHYFASYLDCKSLRNVLNDGSDTYICCQWALIELSLHPGKQDRLRNEMAEFSKTDPTYDQFVNGLPYLDAVFRETLRLHPPIEEIIRVVSKSLIY